MPFKRDLVTAKNTALSTVRLQPGSFQTPGAFTNASANTRERRMTVTFGAANAPLAVYHGLGFAPSGYEVLGRLSAAHIYNDFPLPSSSRVIVLKCDTANVVCDILVR